MSTPDVSRRSLLRFGAASSTVAISAAAGAPWALAESSSSAAAKKRVYVLVTDGCRPDEITSSQTPNLYALRAGGRWYPNARSMHVMETIPNHVMMMTGMRPDRNGVPANSIYDRALKATRDMDRQSDILVHTMLERLRWRGLTTGSVLSKDYLYGVFGTRATYRWEPKPLMPITDHAPDTYTFDALTTMVDQADPNLVFANFGDIDRVGHSDLGGSISLPLARKAALANTDRLVGNFVSHLKATGKWSTSVVVVLADHSMDWSIATNVISLGSAIWADTTLRGKVKIAQNGGADLLYWVGSSASRAAGLQRLRTLVLAQKGVHSVYTPSQLRLGPRAGDLVAYCRAGYRFSDPYVVSNPIPGNHGHPATAPIPFFITGGSSLVRKGVQSGVAHTVDVAPTVGAVFGIGAPAGGYDGVSRL